jgi:hypothetical protein
MVRHRWIFLSSREIHGICIIELTLECRLSFLSISSLQAITAVRCAESTISILQGTDNRSTLKSFFKEHEDDTLMTPRHTFDSSLEKLQSPVEYNDGKQSISCCPPLKKRRRHATDPLLLAVRKAAKETDIPACITLEEKDNDESTDLFFSTITEEYHLLPMMPSLDSNSPHLSLRRPIRLRMRNQTLPDFMMRLRQGQDKALV